ncbi:DUF3800 domain-containing protein [Candidatus Electronema sp. PJ]|uniref:DUF3800 domain-containing protein n=1 Tax=Candidatus Electronema sp. PJ TaxID=3401572 RepID=UPI003AA89800
MAIERRSLFCDESETHAPVFYIGGIECSQRRAEILSNKIIALRNKESFHHEFKWKNIGNNEKYINFYKKFLDIFFLDGYASMRIVRFDKQDRDWKNWSSNEDERFFKCYYCFLMNILKPYARYDILVDEKSIMKPYYWNSLYWSLTNKFKARETETDYRNKKVVESLKPVDSKTNDLIQLVDVAIKSLISSPKGDGRMEIVNHIKSYKDQTKYASVHISDWVFDAGKVKLKKQ